MYSLPEAYFITFCAYGTWLHGNARGSVHRQQNAYDTPRVEENLGLQASEAGRMKQPPVYFDEERRAAIEAAIRETCSIRGWTLHALAVRTNHVHAVVSVGDTPPERAAAALKGNGTRVMRERGCWTSELAPWAKGESTRYLWKEKDLLPVVEYVKTGQDGPLS